MRRYFKGLGAEISEEKSTKGIEDDLHKIIGVCDVCFKDGDPVEIDAILNSIVSIMVTVSYFSMLSFTYILILRYADGWHTIGKYRKLYKQLSRHKV